MSDGGIVAGNWGGFEDVAFGFEIELSQWSWKLVYLFSTKVPQSWTLLSARQHVPVHN